MKKHIALLITFAITLCFAGCKAPVSVETTPTQAPLPIETIDISELPAASQLPMVAVSVPVITQTEYAADNTELFRYNYQNISLVVPDPEVAEKIILSFLNHTDMQDDADKILSEAKNAYTENSQNWTPYLSQVLYEPTRADQSVLSFTGSYTTYSGEPHPETVYSSMNYDILTGDQLHLTDVLMDDVTAESISSLVNDILSQQKDALSLRDDYQQTVATRFAKSLTDDSDWYFSTDGIVFYFAPYDVAPYASGVVKAHIPYEKLTGILKDEYFPRESDIVAGTVAGIPFDEDQEQYTQVADIVLQKDSDQILLYTDHHVQNVRLMTGSWSASGDEFTAEHTVFATDNLTPGDAIMVEGDLSKTLPTILLQYKSNDTLHSVYVAVDSTDNTVKLTEN